MGKRTKLKRVLGIELVSDNGTYQIWRCVMECKHSFEYRKKKNSPWPHADQRYCGECETGSTGRKKGRPKLEIPASALAGVEYVRVGRKGRHRLEHNGHPTSLRKLAKELGVGHVSVWNSLIQLGIIPLGRGRK